MARSRLADIRILRRTHCRRQPEPALLVEHGIVYVVLARPDDFFTPVGRRVRHLRAGRRGVRIAHRQRNAGRRVLHRIEHRHVVRAQLERAVNRPVRIEPRVAAIGGHRIVHVRFRIGPVPLRDHEVALDAARARRRRRHLACRDTIGPVREHLERAPAAERVEARAHLPARLAGLNATVPRRNGRRKGAERLGNLTHALGANLMARGAAARLGRANPLRLRLHGRRNPVSGVSRARELALVGYLHEREPVTGRVVLSGSARVRRGHGGQVQQLAGDRLRLG